LLVSVWASIVAGVLFSLITATRIQLHTDVVTLMVAPGTELVLATDLLSGGVAIVWSFTCPDISVPLSPPEL
jgi:hypothetical protein